MRMGKSPQEACLLVCERIIKHALLPSLKTKDGKPNFNVKFYALNKSGEFGSASIKGPSQYAVCTKEGARIEEAAFLMKWE
jgi:hypothetical protein